MRRLHEIFSRSTFLTPLIEALNDQQKRQVDSWNRGDYSFSDHAFGGSGNATRYQAYHAGTDDWRVHDTDLNHTHPKNHKTQAAAEGEAHWLNQFEPQGNQRIVLPLRSEHVPPHPEIEQHLADHGYKVKDYRAGLATDKFGRDVKIGKVLQKTGPQHLHTFNTDPNRHAKDHEKLQVVISRHPHDVAAMSTGQGWTSCMDMDGGVNHRFLKNDIHHGTHVAYLTNKGDDTAEKPLARIALKPFVPHDHQGSPILRPEQTVYGHGGHSFSETVRDWSEKHFPTQPKKLYLLHPSLYDDVYGGKGYGRSWGNRQHVFSNDDETIHHFMSQDEGDGKIMAAVASSRGLKAHHIDHMMKHSDLASYGYFLATNHTAELSSNHIHKMLDEAKDRGHQNFIADIATHPAFKQEHWDKMMKDPAVASYDTFAGFKKFHTKPEAVDQMVHNKSFTVDDIARSAPHLLTAAHVNHIVHHYNPENHTTGYVHASIMDHPEFSPDHYDHLVNEYSKMDHHVNNLLAAHKFLNDDATTKLVNSKRPSAVSALLRNPASNLQSHHITDMLPKVHRADHDRLLDHPNFNAGHISAIITNAGKESLGRIRGRGHLDLLPKVLSHPKATEDHITQAIHSDSEGVVHEAIYTGKLKEHHYDHIMNMQPKDPTDKNEFHRLADIKRSLLSHDNLPARHVVKLASGSFGPTAKYSALHHPNMPEEELHKHGEEGAAILRVRKHLRDHEAQRNAEAEKHFKEEVRGVMCSTFSEAYAFVCSLTEALNDDQKQEMSDYYHATVTHYGKHPAHFSDHIFGHTRPNDNSHPGTPEQNRVSIPLEHPPAAAHPDVEKHLADHGYRVHDYRAGLATDKFGRQVKIGKVLGKTNAPDHIKKTFQDDPNRASSTQSDHLHVVISRHPHDVAAMSTGQGWSSCMNLDGGSNRVYVHKDVEHGTHVAYLAHKSDPDLKHPVARIAIKPFHSEHPDAVIDKQPEDYQKHTVLRPEGKMYGTGGTAFEHTVRKWTEEKFPVKPHEIYVKDNNLYHDGGSRYLMSNDHHTLMNAVPSARYNSDLRNAITQSPHVSKELIDHAVKHWGFGQETPSIIRDFLHNPHVPHEVVNRWIDHENPNIPEMVAEHRHNLTPEQQHKILGVDESTSWASAGRHLAGNQNIKLHPSVVDRLMEKPHNTVSTFDNLRKRHDLSDEHVHKLIDSSHMDWHLTSIAENPNLKPEHLDHLYNRANEIDHAFGAKDMTQGAFASHPKASHELINRFLNDHGEDPAVRSHALHHLALRPWSNLTTEHLKQVVDNGHSNVAIQHSRATPEILDHIAEHDPISLKTIASHAQLHSTAMLDRVTHHVIKKLGEPDKKVEYQEHGYAPSPVSVHSKMKLALYHILSHKHLTGESFVKAHRAVLNHDNEFAKKVLYSEESPWTRQRQENLLHNYHKYQHLLPKEEHLKEQEELEQVSANPKKDKKKDKKSAVEFYPKVKAMVEAAKLAEDRHLLVRNLVEAATAANDNASYAKKDAEEKARFEAEKEAIVNKDKVKKPHDRKRYTQNRHAKLAADVIDQARSVAPETTATAVTTVKLVKNVYAKEETITHDKFGEGSVLLTHENGAKDVLFSHGVETIRD